jgi:hypothetical protein
MSLRLLANDTVSIAHPTAAWTAQQLREAFPWDEAPRYVLHDRDHAFDSLRATAPAMGIDEVLTAPRAPWQNPFVERFIGSARRDCFDHVVQRQVGAGPFVVRTVASHQPEQACFIEHDYEDTPVPPSGQAA